MQAAIRMPTVLCIDDNAEALKIRIRMLETEGYSVLTANNGAVGLKLLAENSVDVVVLDYMMPEMDCGSRKCHRWLGA
jgi:CheY-like chemotaxis protein